MAKRLVRFVRGEDSTNYAKYVQLGASGKPTSNFKETAADGAMKPYFPLDAIPDGCEQGFTIEIKPGLVY